MPVDRLASRSPHDDVRGAAAGLAGGAPAGVRLAPFLPETVARLRACGELDIDDNLAARLCAMSAATTDRRLAGDRARLAIKGRSGTEPGSLLKGQIPVPPCSGVKLIVTTGKSPSPPSGH